MSEMQPSGADRDGSEHRFLTIEFIDLVGYTDLAERAGSEELGVIAAPLSATGRDDHEERFGGFVAQVVGDGMLVYFGYPVAHENDAERALLAAPALQQAMRDLDTEIRGRAFESCRRESACIRALC